MPSASVLEQKKQIVASVADRISNSCAGVIVDYKGISVADDTALRKELREAGVEYTVVKNTLLKLAINGTSLESMGEVLDGTTALHEIRCVINENNPCPLTVNRDLTYKY